MLEDLHKDKATLYIRSRQINDVGETDNDAIHINSGVQIYKFNIF